MNNRERFKAVMQFKPFDRLPIIEWAGWWDKTIQRWQQEGLPVSLKDRYDICAHLGMDIYRQDGFAARRRDCPSPVSRSAGFIRTEEDYDRIRKHLYPDDPINHKRWEQWTEEQQRGDAVLWFTLEGFFWFPRELLGVEQHLYAFYDQPKLIHRINEDLSAWMLRTIEQAVKICSPDFMAFAEDMSYNKGPMLSEDCFNEFLRPYYDRVIPVLRKHGIIAFIDSDGDVTVPAHWFRKAGIEGILPLERQAGVDIARLRADHPRMRFIGHFDKMTMNKGRERMRAEFERLIPTAAKGGYLIGCDHQTPPGVSYGEYREYLTLFREYAERAGRMSGGITG